MEEIISVCVITYNSEQTVIETLESIKRQTYGCVELIVSDDGSRDETVSKVNSWIKENASFFYNAKLVVLPKNMGTVANLNAAVNASSGTWIKILAGDDLLKENCIERFVYHKNAFPDNNFFVCQLDLFSEGNNSLEVMKRWYDYLHYLQHCSLKKKTRISSYSLIFPGPAWFFSRALYDKLNGFDEHYSLLDEKPFSFYTLEAGNDIIPVDERLVFYRVASNSSSHTGNVEIRKRFLDQDYLFFKEKQLPELKKNCMYLEILDQKIEYWLRYKVLDEFIKKGKINESLMKIRYLSPVYFLSKVKLKLWSYFVYSRHLLK